MILDQKRLRLPVLFLNELKSYLHLILSEGWCLNRSVDTRTWNSWDPARITVEHKVEITERTKPSQPNVCPNHATISLMDILILPHALSRLFLFFPFLFFLFFFFWGGCLRV